jgi:hypothetical protein
MGSPSSELWNETIPLVNTDGGLEFCTKYAYGCVNVQFKPPKLGKIPSCARSTARFSFYRYGQSCVKRASQAFGVPERVYPQTAQGCSPEGIRCTTEVRPILRLNLSDGNSPNVTQELASSHKISPLHHQLGIYPVVQSSDQP